MCIRDRNPVDPEAWHFFSWNSHARDGGFDDSGARAKAMGLEHYEHVDPVGERMTEEERRVVEERYMFHKVVIIIGEIYELVVWEQTADVQFKDGSYAYNGQLGRVLRKEGDTYVVHVHGRPDDDAQLSLGTHHVSVSVPRLGGDVLLGLQFLKPQKYRTVASSQGFECDAAVIHAEKQGMDKPGLLYTALTVSYTHLTLPTICSV